MRILLSSPSFFPDSYGGGERYVFEIARELQRRAHRVAVLTKASRAAGSGRFEISHRRYEGLEVIEIALAPAALSLAEDALGFGPVTTGAVAAVVQDFGPTLVHASGMKVALATVRSQPGAAPLIVTAHHAGMVCPGGAALRPDDAVCESGVSPRSCVPCAAFARRPHRLTGGLIGRLPQRLYRALGRRLSRRARLSYLERGLIHPWLIEQYLGGGAILREHVDEIIAPSLFMRSLLIRNGFHPEAVHLLPHGCAPVERVPVAPLSGRPVRFGYLGRVNRGKGLHLLLEAAALLERRDQAQIHLFGAAQVPWEESYRREILLAATGRASVIEHGAIPPGATAEALVAIDVLVVPSLVPEAFGLVVQEAFAVGRPVIVAASGALPELVDNGVNGIVVPRNDAQALAAAMDRIIAAREWIVAAAQRTTAGLTVAEHVDRLEERYRHVIERCARRSTAGAA